MNRYPDYKFVCKCIVLIENKLNWGNSSTWNNSTFIELSEIIQKQTGVLLSVTTLKRIWGRVNYNNAPSESTLNALAMFAGFKNWRVFKNTSTKKPFVTISKTVSKNLGIIFTSAVIMAILFISIYSMRSINTVKKVNYDTVLFKSKSVSESIPNSVVFNFNIENISSDSIYIQQFWDPSKTIKINKNQQQATGIYYYPGYFRAKLVVDGIIKKEHDLFIKSKGWLATIEYTPIPKYIYNVDKLSFNNNIINEINQLEKPVITSFHYINKFNNFSADNLRLTSIIKNDYAEKWAVCQKTSIIILGTKSAIIIPFSLLGCSSELKGMISEISLNGKQQDLSKLTTNFLESKKIVIDISEKNLTVFIEDKAVFAKKYQNPIGDFVGIRYKFLGAGNVKSIEIQDKKTSKTITDKELR